MEILVIAALAVMVFGRDLPRVAAQAYSKFQKARRALMSVWRESGIGEEMRQMQREIDRGTQELRKVSPQGLIRDTVQDVESQIKSPFESSGEGEFPETGDSEAAQPESMDRGTPQDPAEASSAQEWPTSGFGAGLNPDGSREPDPEPTGEAARRPPWYPETSTNPFDDAKSETD